MSDEICRLDAAGLAWKIPRPNRCPRPPCVIHLPMRPTSPLSRTIAGIITAGLVALPFPRSLQAGDAAAPPTLVPANLFAVPDGLEVTVWATTPLLHNPTNIDIDKDGRVWVAEGVNYRSKANRQPDGDKIVVLEDSTGAGKADKSSVFVQDPDLIAPLGVAVPGNKVAVSQRRYVLQSTDV